MANLDLSKSRAEDMDNLEGSAIKVMQQFFDGKRQGGDDVKLAMQTMNVVAKNRVTTTAREGMRFNMINAITDDPKILKRYVAASQPEIKKLLPGK